MGRTQARLPCQDTQVWGGIEHYGHQLAPLKIAHLTLSLSQSYLFGKYLPAGAVVGRKGPVALPSVHSSIALEVVAQLQLQVGS